MTEGWKHNEMQGFVPYCQFIQVKSYWLFSLCQSSDGLSVIRNLFYRH